MKRRSIVGTSLALVAVVAIAGSAVAAPKLKTFGPAEIRITEGAVTITTSPEHSYGGVYLTSKSMSGKFIGSVEFSFTSKGAVTGGAPRFSIPIDTNGDGTVEGYAFLDAANCDLDSNGVVRVGTTNSTCRVYFGSGAFANWDLFAAAFPGYRIAPGAIPFIIADGGYTAEYEIDAIELR